MELLHSSVLLLPDGKKYRLEVGYDESPDSPRMFDNVGSMCVREHRRYSFPNELGINFDEFDNSEPYETDDDGNVLKTCRDKEWEKLEAYHLFWLDCYEHGGIAFSFRGTGVQCSFDTSNCVGFIAVPKKNGEEDRSLEDAREIAEAELEEYDAYVNGRVYRYKIVELVPLFRKDGTESDVTEDGDETDSCGGIFVLEEIPQIVPHGFKESISDAYALSGGFSV